VPEIVQEIGAAAGLAAVVGLAILSALYFSQARDVKRLREWAGRAPERAEQQAAVAQPQARAGAATPVPGRATPAPGSALAAAAGARPAAATAAAQQKQQPAEGGKPPEAAPVPKSGVPVPQGAAAAAAPQGSAAAPAKPAESTPGDAATENGDEAAAVKAGRAETGDGAPPVKAADQKPGGEKLPEDADDQKPPKDGEEPAAGAAAAQEKQEDGAGPDEAKAAEPGEPEAKPASASAKPDVARGPGVPATPAGARPAQPAAGGRGGTAPPLPPRSAPSRPPAPRPSQTAILPPRAEEPGRPWYRRSPRYLLLAVAGVLVIGGGTAFALSQLAQEEAPTPQAGSSERFSRDGSAKKESTKAQAVNPSSVTVSVLNGTTVAGLAAKVGDRVENLGFQLGNVTNNSDQSRNESVVLYAPGHQREAAAVARKLGISQREPIDAASQALAGDAGVVIIAGSDQI